MNPALELQQGKRRLTRLGRALRLHPDGDRLVAAQRGLGGVEDLGAPSALLGVPRVHAEEVAGEQGRLLAPFTALDLDDDVLAVGGVARHEQVLESLGERRQPRLERLDLVVELQLARGLEVLTDLLPLAVRAQHGGQLGVALADLLGLRGVGVHGRVRHALLERSVLLDERLDGLEHQRIS